MAIVRLIKSEQTDKEMAHHLFAVSGEPTICVYISSVRHNVSRLNADVQEVNAS